MIRVTGLCKNYAAFPALVNVDFTVERGEIVGFLGPNGAGKTTTLRILSGFMPATSGTVEVAGFDVAAASREVRRRTGYLPEDVPLYRDLTVRGYLTLLAGLKEVPPARVRSEVDRVVEAAGLEPVADRLIGKCSKGYRQRTGLAQALLGEPEVLLLDEPTSGLDPNQVVEVRELIRLLAGSRTVLLSSHILGEVAQICTRVLIIHQGRIVGSGTPDDLARRIDRSGTLLVRARTTLDAAAWTRLPGVLEATADPVDAALWRLHVEDAATSAPAVARAVVEGGGALLELRHERADLETVFRSLTREGDDA